MLLNVQPLCYCEVSKLAIVVDTPTATILNPVCEVVEVYHLMHHGCHNIFNRTIEGFRSDVQLVLVVSFICSPSLS